VNTIDSRQRSIATASIGALLDGSTWSTYQKLVTALAAVVTIFDGFDIQILAFTIPLLTREWHVERSQFGPVLATGLVGMALGSLIAGYCGDRFGRRPAILGSVIVFGLATTATAFVHSLTGLTLLRFFTGMGTGGALPNVSALVAEFAPLHRRASAVKLTILCIPLGGMLGGVLAASVLPRFGWRGLYVFGGGLPLLLVVALFAALPESPRFLARRSAEWSRLIALLKRFGHVLPAGTSFDESGASGESGRASVRELFVGGLARDTLGLWASFFCCLGAIYLVFGWLPALLAAQGLKVATASSGLAFYNFGGVLGIVIWAILMPSIGSRGLLVFGALACATSSVALLLVPVGTSGGSNTLLILFIAINGLLANAVQTSMYALAAHVYPTEVRATGVACSVTVGRIGGLLSSFLGGYIIRAGAVRYWQIISLAMVCASAGLATVRNHYAAAGKLRSTLDS
jgi:AAHS family 4-hydroxybenzoate transporter-like MFS transporter